VVIYSVFACLSYVFLLIYGNVKLYRCLLASFTMLRTTHQVLPTTVAGDSFQLLTVIANVTESPSNVNNSRLVFDGDILLLALFSFFMLLNIRRAFSRFSWASEWLQGHILWFTGPDNWRNRFASVPFGHSAIGMAIDKESKGSYAPSSCAYPRGIPSTHAPTHAPSVLSTFHPISSPFTRRVMPGFSAWQAVILGIYGIILQYESFYKSNLFTDPIRTGFVGTAQIPFVFALATKNNLLGGLVGLGYEKVLIR
jgi:ferric-chelate reductase